MDNLTKQYLKNVKTFFPIIGKQEKAYLKNFELNVTDFCEERDISSLEELYRDFGTPTEVANSYFSSVKMDYLLNRINISKKIKYFSIALISILCIGITVMSVYLYFTYNLMQDQMIFFEETTIK